MNKKDNLSNTANLSRSTSVSPQAHSQPISNSAVTTVTNAGKIPPSLPPSQSNSNENPEKEGILRKRGGRMHRWSLRYFMLSGHKISYKIKQDSPQVRAAFDLVPGCIVTEVLEETIGTIKGKKFFTFWIVWPHDKNSKSGKEKNEKEINNNDNNSNNKESNNNNNNNNNGGDDVESDDDEANNKPKDLKHIVESEVMTQRRQQKQVEEQLERHHAHDQNVSLGVKVAAVAVGGVVIGALTAGIGLVPYITVVGITAVAGGGAVLAVRRPSDSRLILACETMYEALAWKAAIELQISKLENDLKPMLPPSADPNIISFLMNANSANGQTWKRIAIFEGMRIMKQLNPMEGTLCRRAQLVVHFTPVTAFLALMEANCWPKGGSVKVLKVIDDHADLIEVNVITDCSAHGGAKSVKRKLCLSRFWKLDEDGIYLITFNSNKIKCVEPSQNQIKDTEVVQETQSKKKPKVEPIIVVEEPSVAAVLTVSPRRDHTEYDDDLPEALVSCTCQISTSGSWEKGELEAFMNDFLRQQLLELRQVLLFGKYSLGPNSEDKSQALLLAAKIAAAGYSSSITQTVSPSSRDGDIHHGTKPVPLGSSGSTGLIPADSYRFRGDGDRSGGNGIATVQPGLDEASAQFYANASAANNIALNSAANSHSYTPAVEQIAPATPTAPAPPVTAKRRLFRRALSSPLTSKTQTVQTPSSVQPGTVQHSKDTSPRPVPYTSSSSVPSLLSSSSATRSLSPGRLRFLTSSSQSSGIGSTPTSSSHSNSSQSLMHSSANTNSSHIPIAPFTDNNNTSSSTSNTGGGVSRAIRGSIVTRRRSKIVNMEASALRGQIAAKEYEVQRLDRLLKRKEKEKNLPASSGPIITPMHQQLLELQELKAQYLKLTGTPYEQNTRRRGALSRLRYLGGGGNRDNSNKGEGNNANGNTELSSISLSSISFDGQTAALSGQSPSRHPNAFKAKVILSNGRPLHWQPTRMERGGETYHTEEGNSLTSADAKVNIAVVAMFAVSMIATMLLANLLSAL